MIISVLRIAAGAKTRDEILAILFSVKGPTESEPQCISCRIYTEPRNDKHITYEEVWQDEASLYQHIRSPYYRNLLAAMDLSTEPPEVRFTTVLKAEGMELMQRVLGEGPQQGMAEGAAKRVRSHKKESYKLPQRRRRES